jgi:hypothetical protein
MLLNVMIAQNIAIKKTTTTACNLCCLAQIITAIAKGAKKLDSTQAKAGATTITLSG